MQQAMATQMLLAMALLASASYEASAVRAAANDAVSLNETAPRCSESAVSGACDCNYYEHGIQVRGLPIPNGLDAIGLIGSYQCSGCKDKSKWGFGCDVPCPDECAFGCDFSGDCVVPPHCVRNWRVAGERPVNARGECAACEAGYSGRACEDECPANCGKSSEGKCTRGGTCYKCQPGFYGEDCSQACPAACPDCVMKDKYADDDGKEVLLEAAGTCPNRCKQDAYGATCDQPCPENCHKILHSVTARLGLGVIPSCYKESGICKRCSDDLWWGERCEQKCPFSCASGKCDRALGVCTQGCEMGSGKMGHKCDEECPAGCAKGGVLHLFERVLVKANGLVGRVVDTFVADGTQRFQLDLVDGSFISEELELFRPACDQHTGVCAHACTPGLFGPKCDAACPNHTHPDSGCDRSTGVPKKCVGGFFVADGICAPCSDTCAGGTCNEKGECTAGCEEGFYGKRCELGCPRNCEGPCDAMATGLKDGRCGACAPGFTGKHCAAPCHPSCMTCATWEQAGSLATSQNACTSCFEHGYGAEPVLFSANSVLGIAPIPPFGFGSCDCIEGASRRGGGSACACDAPEDGNFVERFEVSPKKACRFVCKEGLREVFGRADSACVTNVVYKAVVKAEAAGLKRGGCEQGFYDIPAPSGTECVKEEYVRDILREEGSGRA